MCLGFDAESIVDVDFCLNLDQESGENHVRIPIDFSVKSILISMLNATIAELTPKDGGRIAKFEFSEKYGSRESLSASLNDEGFEKIRALYSEENWLNDNDAVNRSKDLAYYFAVFRDDVGRKLIGVRRASQFKAILSAQNRLIRWTDDSMKVLAENVFRLDMDFDFLITQNSIFILRPSGFEFISDVSSLAAEKAKEKALSLASVLPFIDFNGIAEHASTHRRAARLVAAISIRGDLDKIRKEKLADAARDNKVELEEANGKLVPKSGNELGLLELLDHRRYTTSLTDDDPSAFVASSRQKITL